MLPYRLKELRRREGITQAELARALEVSVGAVGNWESGKRTPDVRTLHRIAECFSVTVDYLSGSTPVSDNGDLQWICPDDAMIGAGIRPGDTVHIRRRDTVSDGRIAAVQIDGQILLRRIYRCGEYLVLQAENPARGPMVFRMEEMERIRIWGEAVSCVHALC